MALRRRVVDYAGNRSGIRKMSDPTFHPCEGCRDFNPEDESKSGCMQESPPEECRHRGMVALGRWPEIIAHLRKWQAEYDPTDEYPPMPAHIEWVLGKVVPALKKMGIPDSVVWSGDGGVVFEFLNGDGFRKLETSEPNSARLFEKRAGRIVTNMSVEFP